MPNEITLIQQAKIMKWLGIPFKNVDEDYLSSPEGEVAMMDTLCPYSAVFFDVEFSSGPDKYEVEIQPFTDVVGADNYFGKALTRNQALQLAILEMLGKEGE